MPATGHLPSHPSLAVEGQGRGDKEKGEGSGHCCPLMPLPTVQAPGMGIGMLGARSNREERGAGETHC